MAYYGIPSAGVSLTASVGNDTVAIANLGGTLVTAQSVYGADGNDIISLGAVGRIVTGSATFSGNVTNGSGADTISGALLQLLLDLLPTPLPWALPSQLLAKQQQAFNSVQL